MNVGRDCGFRCLSLRFGTRPLEYEAELDSMGNFIHDNMRGQGPLSLNPYCIVAIVTQMSAFTAPSTCHSTMSCRVQLTLEQGRYTFWR